MRKEEDIEILLRSIQIYEGNVQDLDERIVKYIENDEFNDWQLFDKNVFQSCFLRGLNKVLLKLLELDFISTDTINIEATDYDASSHRSPNFQISRPLLMQPFLSNEDVVVEILLRCHDQVSASLEYVCPETNETLLLTLLNKSPIMQKAIVLLVENYNLDKLYFAKNVAKDIAFNLAINLTYLTSNNQFILKLDSGEAKSFQNIASIIWFMMCRTKLTTEINNSIIHQKLNGQNILHACTKASQNVLLHKICFESEIDQDVVKKALNQPDSDGVTPLFICDDEETVLKIILNDGYINIDHVDEKGNNVLHNYAEKNFVFCIKEILKSTKDEKKIKNMMLQKNRNGNNPLMECVLKNSNEALNFLLCYLYTMDYAKHGGELVRNLLHDKNKKGETLLALILNYQKSKSMPETVALEMEKMCHSEKDNKDETMTNLTLCLKDHVDPSNEVVSVIKEVEDSYEKTRCGKIVNWMTLFLTSFLIPFGVLTSDMSFDMMLVVAYAEYLEGDDTVKCYGDDLTGVCHFANNSTNQSVDSVILSLERSIPCKLRGKPRFNYSLAFIVIPWIFYGIEFCHSRHLTYTIDKV